MCVLCGQGLLRGVGAPDDEAGGRDGKSASQFSFNCDMAFAMSDTFTILLGGDVEVTDRLTAAISGSRVIAADGGMRHAPALNLVPEMWVGDFDSSDPALFERFARVPRLEYPAAKAMTDGEIAVEQALARRARRLIFVGGLGGTRSDHAFQHLTQGVGLAERGVEVLLTSGTEEAVPLLPGALELDLPKGSLFSILGLDTLTGLSIANARYPLERSDVPFGSARTISNVAEGRVGFALESGKALVIARPYDFTGA